MKWVRSVLLNGISPVTVRPYRAGDIEYVIKRHNELYNAEYGFGQAFGEYVEKYVREFAGRHDSGAENMWIAEEGGRPVGSIALVKASESAAQLRWFLIEPEMRGRGLGRRLMQAALDFCREKKYSRVFLWTVSILDAARHLYGDYGFKLAETRESDYWGRTLTEERWELEIGESTGTRTPTWKRVRP